MLGKIEVESADEDGLVFVDPTDDGVEQVRVSSDSSLNDSPFNQEQQADPSDGESFKSGDSVQIAPDDTRVTEDSGKEEMFVDCPDEIENSEPQMALEEKDHQQDAEVKELGNSAQVNDLIAEIKQLRLMLEQTTAERDNYAEKYEEERKTVGELCRGHLYVKHQEVENYRYAEESAGRILASLGTSMSQEGIVDESISGKMYHVENAMSFLLEKYNLFLYGIDQLRMSLAEDGPDIAMQEEVTLFGTVCNNLLGLKGEVVDLGQKLVHAEEENKQLVDQLKEHKTAVEQERTRYASTREKLSLAVTKGKALVQQRDSLKQSLAEKTSELEKCLIQLNEMSNALATAEQNRDLLGKSETMVSSLQEALAERDIILHTCGEILSNVVGTDEYQSMDIIEKIRYLTEERNEFNRVSMEFRKLVDALSSFDFPETVESSGMDGKIVFLLESVDAAQKEASKLQDELFTTKEAAHDEAVRLSSLLMAETQEKDQALDEKHRVVRMLQEASGLGRDDQEKQNQSFSDVSVIVDSCIAKIKDDFSASFKLSNSTINNFEKMQDLVYISNMHLELYDQILEEEINELVVLRNELNLVNGEKDSLQKDLGRSEEKAAMLREKLSMAVKKGKGLHQERENLSKTLDVKNSEIENLTLELQEQRSACINLRDEINRLTVDLERVPQLETDIFAIQEQKNQVEKFLAESNSLLQKVLESIDEVGFPDGTTFNEPVEKVNWLAGYLSESQRAKSKARNEVEELEITVSSLKDSLSASESKIKGLIEENEGLVVSKVYVEQKLQKAIEESSSLTNKYMEVCATQKSLEDALEAKDLAGKMEEVQIMVKSLKEALSAAESKISELTEEKEGLTVSKSYFEQELKNAIEECSSLTNKFAEVCSNKKSLEDALQAAERNIIQLTDEKEATKIELEKVKEEVTFQTSKLSEADRLKQSLEENLLLLAEDNEKAKSNKIYLENELKMLKEEVDSHVLRFADANSTIQSLQGAVFDAEEKISGLVNEKKNAEEEISSLNFKLNDCMQELAGTHGSLQSTSTALSGHLSSLRRLLKGEPLSSSLLQIFEKKIGALKDVNILLEEVGKSFIEVDSDILRSFSSTEDGTSPLTISSSGLDYALDVKTSNGEENSTDAENIVFSIGKALEQLQLRDKVLAEKVEDFSVFMDNLILSLIKKLHIVKTTFISMPELIKSLKQKVDELESGKQALKDNIFILESSNGSLLPACTTATKELKLEFEQCLSELKSNSHRVGLNDIWSIELGTFGVNSVEEDQLDLASNDYEKAAKEILFAARQSRDLNRHFQNVVGKMITTIDYLQNEVKESKTANEQLLEEHNLSENEVMKLKTDLQNSEDACKEMKVSLEEYKQRENNSKTGEYVEHYNHNNESEKMKNELLNLAMGLESIIQKLGGDESLDGNKEAFGVTDLLQVLETRVMASKMESKTSKAKADELNYKLLEMQKVVDNLSSKIRLPQDSSQSKEIIRERGFLESSSFPVPSEISEIQDMGPVGKNIATRTLRKGSGDHLAINVDSDSELLINEEKNGDKGHVFKSLNTSGLIPRQGKMIADRVDGMWVSGSRGLMNHPRARLGLISYWLLMHLWFLASIL